MNEINEVNENDILISVTFKLDQEMFAVEIAKVQEVLELTSLTKVPQTPPYMKGVINLRGNVVPVVDLRMRFGLGETVKSQDARIIILEVAVEGEKTMVGALADSVREVIELSPNQVGPAPKIGTRVCSDYIRGIGRKDEEFLMILDIDKVFSAEELMAVANIVAAVPENNSSPEASAL